MTGRIIFLYNILAILKLIENVAGVASSSITYTLITNAVLQIFM